ncbi:50S ribosomal protein L22 [Candidatus Woesearchaeota archaeon]|nr:MAG: 50S ribosomal protein L22 [Candidatus Woesearchaeota archaeon]
MAYAFATFKKETMARAQMRDAPISFKQAIELARNLRGMMSDKAERYLENVIALRQPVPYTRFTEGAGHKRGIGAAKYPVKTAKAFKELLKAAVANAENQGLGTPLKIIHLLAQEGSRPLRPGRKRGTLMKRTSIEIVLAETDASRKQAKKPKPRSKAASPPPKARPSPGPAKAAQPRSPAKQPSTEKPVTVEQPQAQAQPEKPAPPRSAPGAEQKISGEEKTSKPKSKPETAASEEKTDEVKKDGR